jgi:hypothetical protein
MVAADFRHGWHSLAILVVLFSSAPASAAPVALPDGTKIEKVDFERHVQGLLGRLGCNAGACHGSFQGKGGLYLSLFGYSPEKDYAAFTRADLGRRISIADPDASLLLAKASGRVPHGGGKRMERDSWQYNVIREWIAGGAAWQSGSGDVRRMDVTPKEHLLAKPGATGKFKVTVEFADGSKEDMTSFGEFRVNDDYVAELAADAGAVTSLRPGHSAVVVSYRGNVQSAQVLVKVPMPAGFVYPAVGEVNFIDREVFAKLKRLNIVPSDLASDGEFLRRVTIDTIGQLPSPDEVRAFLADKTADKRARKIDELLKHPLHAALWATKFSDITGNNIDTMEQPQQLRPKRSKMWHDWFRRRITENMPYDEIVKGVLCATSRDGQAPDDWIKQALEIEGQAGRGWESDYAKRTSLDLFWRRNNFTLQQKGEHTAAAFLGIRLECAQCHKHPFDRWTQDDYKGYANVFASVQFTTSKEGQALIAKQQAAQRKALADAIAELDKETAAKKKPIEERLDKENAEKRKELSEKLDRENAEKRKALEEKLADEPADKRKAALVKFDTDSAAADKKALAALEKTLASAKRDALAAIEREAATKRRLIQAKFRAPVFQLREVMIGEAPTGGRRPAATTSYPGIRPKSLGGPEIDPQGDPRVALWEWMRAPENPYFARSFVNRVWGHYFGSGIVDPVDNFSVANPPSNELLLDALAEDFVKHKYDIRRLEQTVLASRTYQLSSAPNETNRHDRNSYSRSYPRRMMAEVVVDVLSSALGTTENFGPEVPPGVRAVEVAPNRLRLAQNLGNVFNLFGRPPRTSTCDCERAAEPALPQTLYLMTDSALLTKIDAGRLKQLLAAKKTDEEVVEELVLATLSRLPTEKEKERLVKHVQNKAKRDAGFADVVWALINTREFILNH